MYTHKNVFLRQQKFGFSKRFDVVLTKNHLNQFVEPTMAYRHFNKTFCDIN